MKKQSDIKCPFCGNLMLMVVDTFQSAHAYFSCNKCEARGPSAYSDQEWKAEEAARRAMADYQDRIDAALWRAARVRFEGGES